MIMGAKTALFSRIAAVVSDTEGVAHDEVMRALTPVSDLLSWAIGGAALVVLAHVRYSPLIFPWLWRPLVLFSLAMAPTCVVFP